MERRSRPYIPVLPYLTPRSFPMFSEAISALRAIAAGATEVEVETQMGFEWVPVGDNPWGAPHAGLTGRTRLTDSDEGLPDAQKILADVARAEDREAIRQKYQTRRRPDLGRGGWFHRGGNARCHRIDGGYCSRRYRFHFLDRERKQHLAIATIHSGLLVY